MRRYERTGVRASQKVLRFIVEGGEVIGRAPPRPGFAALTLSAALE
jgi:hypothetical protein